MSTRVALVALLLALGLRVVACDAHAHPRGDVLLDVGVARSLAAGEGFASGFVRAVPRVAGADTPVPPQGLADQHPPLWPAAAALPAALGLPPFLALRLLGLAASLGVLMLVLRMADRLAEGVVGADERLPGLAALLVGGSFVMVDAAGNGSLYAAQALGVLLLVECLAAARPSPWLAGLLLGALVQLNHQCLVLLPLPPLVLGLAARPGARGRALLVGALAVLTALAVQLPWWWRNAQVFGDPFFSVNGLYLLYRAGVETTFGVEQGVPVIRLVGELGPADLPRVFLGNLRQNLPWLAAALPLATGGAVGVVLAGLPRLAGALRRGRDARLLGLVGALLLLGAASALWPATKLRYLVPLTPLVVLLAARVLAGGGRRGASASAGGATAGRRSARAVGLAAAGVTAAAWGAALLLTVDDVLGEGLHAHPARWAALALGAGLLVLVLAAVVFGRGAAALALAVTASLLLSVSVGARALVDDGRASTAPGTAYHSTWFLPDVFGQDAEFAQELRAEGVAELVAALPAAADGAGRGRVLGPLELLAHPGIDVVELGPGLPPEILAAAVGAWTPPSPRAVGHVLLAAEEARALPGAASARAVAAPVAELLLLDADTLGER